MFERVLVANRAEVAARIVRTLHELGIEAVAVCAPEDRGQPHTRLADATVDLSTTEGVPYLDIEALVGAAVRTGCDAVHPGYGFLSENPAFPRALEAEAIAWVGPPPHALEALGDKARALELARQLGVPTTPGSQGRLEDVDHALAVAEDTGYPVVLKAVHGGGGMGMQVVHEPAGMEEAWRTAREQAELAFGSPEVLLERWWQAPRHVEVQVALDAHGQGVHLFERECSLQRRQQKLVEEAPAPCVDEDLRATLTGHALELCHAAGVTCLATVEFLVTEQGPVFNEVNPRLQVEHPVTELVTGQDLVAWQLALAAGEALPRTQDELSLEGWAIEARVNAEDPLEGFAPSPGAVEHVHIPQGEGVRVDHALVPGGQVVARYDSLVAKVIAHGPDRSAALERCRGALAELEVGGPITTAGYLHHLLGTPEVEQARMHTGLVESGSVEGYRELVLDAMASMAGAVQTGEEGTVQVDGHRARWERTATGVLVDGRRVTGAPSPAARDRAAVGGRNVPARALPRMARAAGGAGDQGASVPSPIPGTVVEVLVQAGDPLQAGQPVAVVEAMKMKNRVPAPGAGVVASVEVGPGDTVDKGDALVLLE